MMTERLINSNLKAWHALEGNQLKEEEMRGFNHESVQLYIKLRDERFPDRKGQLKMFLLFLLQAFRKQVYDITSQTFW